MISVAHTIVFALLIIMNFLHMMVVASLTTMPAPGIIVFSLHITVSAELTMMNSKYTPVPAQHTVVYSKQKMRKALKLLNLGTVASVQGFHKLIQVIYL